MSAAQMTYFTRSTFIPVVYPEEKCSIQARSASKGKRDTSARNQAGVPSLARWSCMGTPGSPRSRFGYGSRFGPWGIGGGGGGLIWPRHGTDDFCFLPVGLASSTAMPARMASRIESQNRVGMSSRCGVGSDSAAAVRWQHAPSVDCPARRLKHGGSLDGPLPR